MRQTKVDAQCGIKCTFSSLSLPSFFLNVSQTNAVVAAVSSSQSLSRK